MKTTCFCQYWFLQNIVSINKWVHDGDEWYLLMIPIIRLSVLSLKPCWSAHPPLSWLCLFWRLIRRMERDDKSHLTFKPGDLTWSWNCVVRIERQRWRRCWRLFGTKNLCGKRLFLRGFTRNIKMKVPHISHIMFVPHHVRHNCEFLPFFYEHLIFGVRNTQQWRITSLQITGYTL